MRVAGLLLTGGASTRMGRDKATIMIGGETMAARVARALTAVADPVLVVGHEAGTGLETVEDPREGPLVAVAAGRRALLERGFDGPALVVACDLPFVTAELLSYVARVAVESTSSAVPILAGREQTLCACYSREALDDAARLAESGERSMKSFLESAGAPRRIAETEWCEVAPRDALTDADAPGDLPLTSPD